MPFLIMKSFAIGPVMEYEWYIEYGGMVPKGENQEKELPSEAVPPKEAAPFLSCP